MQDSQVPAKLTIPFANNAPPTRLRTIPVPSQATIDEGAASFTDGFPPVTFLQIGSGGIPPDGRDVNGILKQITEWLRWFNAGGPIYFDAPFAALIGGYPKGAVVCSSVSVGIKWTSTVENNLSNPDGPSPTGWTTVTTAVNQWSAAQFHSSPIYLFNAVGLWGYDVGNTTPRPLVTMEASGYSSFGSGVSGWRISASSGASLIYGDNAGNVAVNGPITFAGNVSALTSQSIGVDLSIGRDLFIARNLNVGGAIGSVGIIHSNTSLDAPYVQANTSLRSLGSAQIDGALTVVGNVQVNGAATVNSNFNVGGLSTFSGNGNFLSNLNAQGAFTSGTSISGPLLQSAGDLNVAGTSNLSGNVEVGLSVDCFGNHITAHLGRVRSNLGALGSGDGNAVAILYDFLNHFNTGNDSAIYQRLPSGFVIQAWHGLGSGAFTVAFPDAFPNYCANVIIQDFAPGGWGGVAPTIMGAQDLSAASFSAYILQWDTGSKTWGYAVNAQYRYWAIGW